MNANLAALLYLVSGILFILALRGLSSPATSRQGNRFGMIGMAIAIVDDARLSAAAGLVATGCHCPRHRHRRRHRHLARAHVQMTAMPQLVASFHASSVSPPSASRRARSTRRRPSASARRGDIHRASLVEMSIGVAIGAITFTGSIIAFLKLDGRMSGKPILLPQRHVDQRRSRRACSCCSLFCSS